jgi:SAM-dependent methyltransferase
MTYLADYYANYTGPGGDWEQSFGKRKYYYDAMARIIARVHPQAASMVEVGCGLGMFTFAMASRNQDLKIVAGDISDYAVTVAGSKLAPFANVKIMRLDAEDLPFENASVDIVTAFDVAEHLPNPEKLMEAAWRVLRPGGTFIFTTPNPTSLGARIKRKGQVGEVPDDKRFWFALRDATHINLQPPSFWRQLCLQSGFEKIEDGSDFWWDTPYVPFIPDALQRLVFNGSHQILMRLVGYCSWQLGENYIGVWKKPAYTSVAHDNG